MRRKGSLESSWLTSSGVEVKVHMKKGQVLKRGQSRQVMSDLWSTIQRIPGICPWNPLDTFIGGPQFDQCLDIQSMLGC